MSRVLAHPQTINIRHHCRRRPEDLAHIGGAAEQAARLNDPELEMINDQLRHSTLYSERTCVAPLSDMFELYSNARARERWNVAFDTTSILYERVDFRVGGIDLFRWGSREGPQYLGQTIYLDIIPPSRIVFSESVSEGERNVCAILNTVTFEQMGIDESRTHNAASFIHRRRADHRDQGRNDRSVR